MKTNIWILNHYASDMYFDRGGRHYNFAKYLRRAGYAPVIFGANSKHGKPERFLETDALWEERIAEEIDTLIENLKLYSDAIKANDSDTLHALLKDGREKKAIIDGEIF